MMLKKDSQHKPKTSWQPVSQWYNRLVDEEGHYYHQHVVLPNLLRLMKLQPGQRVLDLACGQGILSRSIPQEINYLGIDIAPSLIEEAKKIDKNPLHRFWVGDITRPIKMSEKYDWAVIILALQNIASPYKVFLQTKHYLKPAGKLVIVLNHPCFRIPQNSDWGYDPQKNLQYRRLDQYLTKAEIAIKVSPSKEKSVETVSYHYPLSAYVEMLHDNGFMVETMEEWISDKKSTGPMAGAEDRARAEFPLFLTIVARCCL